MNGSLSKAFADAQNTTLTVKPNEKQKISAKPKPFSLRLSFCERALLDQMAGNRPLGAYIRARLFGDQASPRKLHQRRASIDDQALAQALAILGQSRIASCPSSLWLFHWNFQPFTSPLARKLINNRFFACPTGRPASHLHASHLVSAML